MSLTERASQFTYKNHKITIAPASIPLEFGNYLDGYYCVIFDPKGEQLDIDPDCFLTLREEAIAQTKKIVDSIT